MLHFAPSERLLAYAIAGLAGFVDASGFLAADRFFVSFMSGNTTRLGVELAGGGRAALVAGLLLAGFVLGVAAGAVMAEKVASRRKTAVLAASGALLLLAAAGQALGSTAAFLGFAVIAMGAINNVFRRDGQVALGVTYMTGALVRMGEGLAGWLTGSVHGRKGALPSFILWSSLAAGACGGALLFSSLPLLAPWAAGLWALALVVCAWRMEQGPA
ncbi:YoaK family protein [Alteraurantiacibacter palmitatis]|uniref:YoaK family protein n=1 Tax=Alteraurantiacibacter palmitatis TaxID=2054628 RepID=A0ABV7E4T6_9SPHN